MMGYISEEEHSYLVHKVLDAEREIDKLRRDVESQRERADRAEAKVERLSQERDEAPEEIWATATYDSQDDSHYWGDSGCWDTTKQDGFSEKDQILYVRADATNPSMARWRRRRIEAAFQRERADQAERLIAACEEADRERELQGSTERLAIKRALAAYHAHQESE